MDDITPNDVLNYLAEFFSAKDEVASSYEHIYIHDARMVGDRLEVTAGGYSLEQRPRIIKLAVVEED